MDEPMTPATIASGLSAAQKRALLSVSTTHYRKLKPVHSRALGADLRWRLLLQDGSDYTLSHLGFSVLHAVRRHLAAQREGGGDV